MVSCHMEKLGPSTIQKGFKIGVASDFWHLYEDDIAKAAELGTALPLPASFWLHECAAAGACHLIEELPGIVGAQLPAAGPCLLS